MPSANATSSQTLDALSPLGLQELDSNLAIAGWVPMSSVDWPGNLVGTVFLQGCPLRCGYCHNPDLIDPLTPGIVAWSDIVAALRKRVGLLDGVVFSGGEPTRQRELIDAVRGVKQLGFGVGIHTMGAYPRRIHDLLPMVDWVGFDIKAPWNRYKHVAGLDISAKAQESLQMLRDAQVEVQVRTTIDPTVMTIDDCHDIERQLQEFGVENVVWQEARPDGATAEYGRALNHIWQKPGSKWWKALTS